MSPHIPSQDIAQFNIQIRKEIPRTFDTARNIILDWAEQKFGHPMKRCSRSGEPFCMRTRDKAVVSMADLSFWALTLHQLTEEGLPYATDVCLRYKSNDRLFLNAKITLNAPEGDKKLLWEVPPFVSNLADNLGLMDAGQGLQAQPIKLMKDGDAQKLHDVLFNASRALPVIVVAGMRDRASKQFVFPMKTAPLAQRLYGIASVYTMNNYVRDQFAKLVPNAWSLPHGSIRYYRPGADLAQTDVFSAHPYDHLDYVRRGSPQTYADDLHDRILRDSVRKPAATQQVNSFKENLAQMQPSGGLLAHGL